MREIKFRVWYDGKMIYRNPIMSTHEFYLIPEGSVLFPKEPGKVNGKDHSAVLLQYTGLKDKNGKEIYEGDIMLNENGMWSSNDPQPGVRKIIWVDDESKFVHAYTDGNPGVSGTVFCKGNEKYFEVIGNIYENAELLTNDKARVSS